MSTVLTDNQHYADIADAIRAISAGEETYLPSEMSTPLNAAASEITAQEGIIAQIQAALIGKGSGALPTSISKIDGGSFTLDSDTAISTYPINHNLGVIPKGAVLWTEDDIENPTITTSMILREYWNGVPYYESSTQKGGFVHHTFKRADLTVGNSLYSWDYGVTDKLSSTQLKLGRTEVLKAGYTYKWIAWV